MSEPPIPIAVVGGAECSERERRLAYETGWEIARAGALLLCGGRSGIMEAAARGARSEGGSTLGILPGVDEDESAPNPYIDTAVFTGIGQARNLVLVLSARAVIGIGGGWGTLSEIAMALKHGKPVVLLESWDLTRPDGTSDELLYREPSPAQAVTTALRLAAPRSRK